MKKLRELRIKHGLTTTELGKAIGCTNPTITNYELGNRKPDPETLVKLADYFNVSVDYLIGRTENKPLEWTPEEKALGVGSHSTHLSAKEWEWVELRSEIIENFGEAYLDTVAKMLQTLIENNPKK